MGQSVRQGSVTAVKLLPGEKEPHGKLNSCSISLTQPQGSQVVWTIEVQALLFERGAIRELGRIQTVMPANSLRPGGVVALASCPGCLGFRAIVSAPAATGGAVAELADVELGACPELLGVDLIAVEPYAQIIGERFDFIGDTAAAGANAWQIPLGSRLQTFSAWQVGTGGIMSIDGWGFVGANTVPLPPDGSAQIAPRGTLRGNPFVICRFNNVPAGGGGVLLEYLT